MRITAPNPPPIWVCSAAGGSTAGCCETVGRISVRIGASLASLQLSWWDGDTGTTGVTSVSNTVVDTASSSAADGPVDDDDDGAAPGRGTPFMRAMSCMSFWACACRPVTTTRTPTSSRDARGKAKAHIDKMQRRTCGFEVSSRLRRKTQDDSHDEQRDAGDDEEPAPTQRGQHRPANQRLQHGSNGPPSLRN